MIPATPEQQRQLLELQQLDLRIGRLRRHAADLPEQHAVDTNAQQLRSAARTVQDLAARLRESTAERASAAEDDSGQPDAAALSGALADVRARGEQLAERHRHLQRTAAEAADRIAAELEHLRSRRDEAASRIDAALLVTYEQRRRSRRGLAVVAVRDGTCGGCGIVIPPRELEDARSTAAVGLSRCPECDRFLVFTD